MKTKLLIIAVVTTAVVGNFISCKKEDSASIKPKTAYLDLPAIAYNYSGQFPNEVATLGRVLFYDAHLSVNNAVACGSCHKQALAFSDNVAFSRGFENHLALRNTLPIQNIPMGGPFFGPANLFWDGRAQFLPAMVLMPIANHIEMGMSDLNALVERLKGLPYYDNLFQEAYGSTEITKDEVSTALAAFTSSIFSNKTRFDRYMMGQASLSAIEQQGKDLFSNKYNCNGCHHVEQSFFGYPTDSSFINIGLDVNYSDNGVGLITGNPADNGKFRIPSLRNVALTAPYMHDGRFATLDEVLEHYSHGIANHPNLDSRLKTPENTPIAMNISSQEKVAIVALLNTFTDYSMITDPKFSSPFKVR